MMLKLSTMGKMFIVMLLLLIPILACAEDAELQVEDQEEVAPDDTFPPNDDTTIIVNPETEINSIDPNSQGIKEEVDTGFIFAYHNLGNFENPVRRYLQD